MGLLDVNEYRRWMSQAVKTLELVEADIAFEGYSWACFKAQQAAEYALKATLYLFGEPAFGRDLVGLARRAEKLCGSLPESVWDCIYMLDKMYIPPRYPDAFPEGAPWEHYSRKEAVEARECASRVIEWVGGCASRAGVEG